MMSVARLPLRMSQWALRGAVNRAAATQMQANNSSSEERKAAEAREPSLLNDGKVSDVEAPKTEQAKVNSMDELEATIEKLTAEKAELLDKYKRALAETENVRARGRREIEQSRLFAVQAFCKDLLDVADTLQKAVDSVSKEQLSVDGNESLRTLYDGVVMTKTNLMQVFAKHGVTQVNPLGEQFDPNLHEAVVQLPPTGQYTQSKQIARVLTIGYNLHNRPIRAAKVAVIQ